MINAKKIRADDIASATIAAELLIKELRNPHMIFEEIKDNDRESFDFRACLTGNIAGLLNFGTKKEPLPDNTDEFIALAERKLAAQKEALESGERLFESMNK